MIFRRFSNDMDCEMRAAFTLIELLIVIAIIAILAVVIVLVLNPAELLKQSRDANRLSDAQSLNSALGLYNTDQGGAASFNMGSSSVLYVSIPDPTATSTAGDQCQGLGLPSLPAGWTYHCASPTSYHNTDGTGWLPVDLKAISAGSPLGSLPVDPTNETSTWDYYTYATNGTQFQLYSHFESSKNVPDEAATEGYDPASYKIGTNVNIAPFAGGMTGYWPFAEGSGGTTADLSGYDMTGTLQSGVTWTTGPPGGGGVSFNGTNTGYIQLSNNMSSTILSPTGFTICAWVDPNTGTNPSGTYYDIFGDKPSQFGIWSWGGSPSYFGVGLSENYSETASAQQSFYSNSWHEVCGVQSAAGIATIYIDGLSATMTNQNTGSPTIPTFPAGYIGTDYGADGEGTNNFNGVIGTIRIYQRMLDAQEVAGMYKDGE